ncbi:MAG: helix-turn-helix transcriptional regulator [Spirochaetales bacterium]|nr:helix-turn-helix transcriptional regulator [Candidatus Physcosoma equi]
MARREHSFKRRTLTRWMLSYLLATLIPLLLILVTAIVTLYVNSSSITYSNTITASYVQRSFHDVLNRINEIKAEMIVDNDFDEVRSAKQLNQFSSLDLSYHAADIRRLEQTSTLVEKLFIFSPINDWYISDQSWGRLSELSTRMDLLLNQDVVNGAMREEIWDVSLYDLSENNVLILLPMTYIRSFNQNNLSVGIIVAKKNLFPAVLDAFHDVVIYSDRQNKLVYSLSGRYQKDVFDSRFSNMENGATTKLDKYIASVGDDPILGLKCIVLMNRETYFHNYNVLIEVLAFALFAAAVSGAILAYRSTRRNWTRFEEAVEASGVDLTQFPQSSGDYAPFVSSVSTLKAQREELSNVITQQKTSLVESAFHKLLDGDTTVTKETLSALGVEMVSDYFCVIIASSALEDVSGYLKARSEGSLVIPFQSDYGEAFIINPKQTDEDYFLTTFQNVQNEGFLDTLSVSLLHEGLDSIRDSYLEALSVHEYQKDHDIAFLSYAEMVSTTRQNTYQFTLEESMTLQKAMKEGDAEKAKAVMNKVIDRNRENGVSPKTLRFLLFSISGTIIRTINSLDDRYSEVVPEINFPPILQSQNFQKSLSGVEEIIDATCYSIAAISAPCADSSSETYQVYKKVLSYIQENYGNAMMNVSSIADSFDISIAYLSRIFKKYHGINISEYITNYRLDRAKELLSEGRMVGEVVDECGFGSLRTFLRVFKSVEGITPGQYKSSVVKEN